MRILLIAFVVAGIVTTLSPVKSSSMASRQEEAMWNDYWEEDHK
jgi:hypothetical protein